MIYLTGDVHARIEGNWEQEAGGSELDAAIRYLEILKKHKIKTTLFMNGISLKEESEKVKKILEFDVELGGHTYNNFGRMSIFKSYFRRKFYGCIYGSRGYQNKDITKTKEEFEKMGLKMSSWRTHAFGSNEETFKILKENEVKFVSDFVGGERAHEENGIIHIPINIPVDQNTIAYGLLKPENKDVFASCTKGRISPDEWLDILKKRIIKNEKEKKNSVLLIHPETMKVLDNFKLFEKVAEFLSKYKTGKLSEFRTY
ncbi:polysaccharide deacetylase family protein [Candidatus Pacearchaeota archaeon]|nr:polysaccharide deacetylase family protein [Candidatus Pacearchaeota archaeon]